MMRLMVVGSDKVYAIENFYVRYLAELGVEIKQFPAQSIFYDYYQQGLFHKILFKAGLSSILKEVNRQFREQVNSFRPDIIWIFKGMEIYPSSIRWARQQNIRVANYNPDNPFIFTGKGSGNSYVTDALPLYDLHQTYNLQIKQQLEEKFGIRTVLLPFGFDLSQELFEISTRQEEVNKVCFLGNPDEQRAAFINGLAGQGVDIDVYGNGWKDFARHSAISVHPAVYAEEFWKTLRRYRVQLNLMRVHNEDSHNMRSFEIPGVGGIMLAPATTEHRLFFRNKEEVFLFDDIKDCARQADILLGMDMAEADEIRQKARQRSIGDGYSYKSRALQVLEQFQQLCAS
jgi:hypothetical protein